MDIIVLTLLGAYARFVTIQNGVLDNCLKNRHSPKKSPIGSFGYLSWLPSRSLFGLFSTLFYFLNPLCPPPESFFQFTFELF